LGGLESPVSSPTLVHRCTAHFRRTTLRSTFSGHTAYAAKNTSGQSTGIHFRLRDGIRGFLWGHVLIEESINVNARRLMQKYGPPFLA